MRSRTPSHLVVAAVLAFIPVLPSCIFAIGDGQHDGKSGWVWEDEEARKGAEASPGEAKASAKPAGDAKEKSEKTAADLVKKRREFEHAELELVIAESKAAEQEESAVLEVRKAERAVAEAQRDLDVFLGQEMPQATAKSELDLERQLFRVEQQRQELQQLTDDYTAQGEEFYAKRTGQIVIWRTRRELEMAEKAIEQRQATMALEQEHELPKKRRALEFALEKAQADLTQAKAKQERARIEARLMREKAKAKVEEARTELEKQEKDGADAKSDGEDAA